MQAEKPILKYYLMLPSSKLWASLPIFFLLPLLGFSQPCKHVLQGILVDAKSGDPIYAASVLLEEQERGILSDSAGFFRLDSLCEDHFHVHIERLGYESQKLFIDHVGNDSILRIILVPTGLTLDGVLITENAFNSTQQAQSINEQRISDNANLALSSVLEAVTGVNSIKSGGAISKPVVHGLYGNRLTILNNGIAQAGQQWGNDHSPEIDPLVASTIRVVKGVGALAYPGTNLGAVVLIEPGSISKDPHIHGKAILIGESNGRTQGLNVQLEQSSNGLSWKINGTLKRSGDRKSANYFLRNTGNRDAHIAIQLEKVFSDRFKTDIYFSSFNTELGVLRGSHIGNLTDLELAFSREVPFSTEDTFSRQIEAPKQSVNHHLLKIHSNLLISHNQSLDFTVATQLNKRKEFDVRRSGRTEIPAMSLSQITGYTEAVYQRFLPKKTKLKTGIQLTLQDNTNDPETGILPLIPDYQSLKGSVFLVMDKKLPRWMFEWGARYDYETQYALPITRTFPREVLRFTNNFHNGSVSAGLRHTLIKGISLAANVGYTSRNPAVNELYSNGLHQGVSGIEEGDINLSTERAIKSTLGLEGELGERFAFESLWYVQYFQDYIYLQPQNEFRLTIRGSFPVFAYEQTNAQIFGWDFSSQFLLTNRLSLNLATSLIKGRDLSQGIPLVNIPSNNIKSSIQYQSGPWKKVEKFEIAFGSRYVFRQNNLLPDQDFALPPPAYHLLNMRVACNLGLGEFDMRIFASADNLFNTAYRDYLNRLRYFADDLGRNITVGLQVSF